MLSAGERPRPTLLAISIMLLSLIKDNIAGVASLVFLSLSIYVMYKETKRKSDASEESKTNKELLQPEVRYYSHAELAKYNGETCKNIYTAVKGEIYDLTGSESMYGRGRAYAILSGHDSTLALAKNSLDMCDIPDNNGPTAKIDGLSKGEMDSLDDWHIFYRRKYPLIGLLVQNDDPRAGSPIQGKDLHLFSSVNNRDPQSNNDVDGKLKKNE